MAGPERRVLGLVLAGLTLVGIASLTSWFLTHFERVSREVPTGASPEARRNPLLAANRFLERLGITVESVPGRGLLRRPPPVTDTLVVRGLGPMGEERRAALRAWIKEGGHLVVEAMEPWDASAPPDDLLADLGIRLRALEEDGDAGTEAGSEVLGRAASGPGEAPLTVAFRRNWYLESDADDGWEARVADRARLVRLPLGEGTLTALSDTEFMTNRRIGDNDHALFAAQLVGSRAGGKVWLLYDSRVPWLGEILWGTAPLALVSGALLLLGWARSLGIRLGPLEPPPGRRRRDLLEHLDAAGAFQWRHEGASHLVEPTRRRVLGVWERHRPELRRMEPREQAAVIAAAAGQPMEGVTRALLGQADDPRAFVDQAARLQTLWKVVRPARAPIRSGIVRETAAMHRTIEGDG